jgi:hypothetical protein
VRLQSTELVDREDANRQVSPNGGKGGGMRSGHMAGQWVITGGMTSGSPALAPTGGIISFSPTMWNEAAERDEKWGRMNTTSVIDFRLTWPRL